MSFFFFLIRFKKKRKDASIMWQMDVFHITFLSQKQYKVSSFRTHCQTYSHLTILKRKPFFHEITSNGKSRISTNLKLFLSKKNRTTDTKEKYPL